MMNNNRQNESLVLAWALLGLSLAAFLLVGCAGTSKQTLTITAADEVYIRDAIISNRSEGVYEQMVRLGLAARDINIDASTQGLGQTPPIDLGIGLDSWVDLNTGVLLKDCKKVEIERLVGFNQGTTALDVPASMKAIGDPRAIEEEVIYEFTPEDETPTGIPLWHDLSTVGGS